MRPLNDTEKEALSLLQTDMEEKMEALRDAEALYSQAVTAHAFACSVPPRDHLLARDMTWHVVVGKTADGQPVTKPVEMES